MFQVGGDGDGDGDVVVGGEGWRSKCLAPSSSRTIRALVAATSLVLIFSASASQAADLPRLLLLPVVVHSAEDPDYLRSGLSDMLASRFARIGALELVRGEIEGRGTTDPEAALELARKKGADYVLYGSFTRFGQGASLDVQCAPVDPAPDGGTQEPLREIFVHSGSIGEIIPDLDELAGKVSRFARGELVASGVPASPGNAGGGAPAASAQVLQLTDRVEALEAMLAELLESADNSDNGANAENAQ